MFGTNRLCAEKPEMRAWDLLRGWNLPLANNIPVRRYLTNIEGNKRIESAKKKNNKGEFGRYFYSK
jgi:hypothetical protein